MPTSWDYIEDVRFVLQEPPKSKRASRLSIRQLFPDTRSPGDMAQISERPHERVSVEYPRGRAPRLHLRLSELDFSPIMRTLRSSPRSTNPLHTHLIPETPLAMSMIREVSDDDPDVRYPYHRNVSSDVLISPVTLRSAWPVTGPTSKDSSSTNRAILAPRPSAPPRDERFHSPCHTRERTMSSTLSNLPEVMTLSGSPPDPGFVLPIHSRSRGRQNYDRYLASATQFVVCDAHSYATNSNNGDVGFLSLQGLQHVEDTPFDYGHHIAQMNESNVVLPPLEPPWPRQPSWASGSSDASSAVISTAARLRRAHTITGVTSVAIRRADASVSLDNVRTGQRNTIVTEYLLDNPLTAVHVERSGRMV